MREDCLQEVTSMDIFLRRQAVLADGELQGRTRITAVEAETSDDEPGRDPLITTGFDQPWLARLGRPTAGTVRGRTLSTRAIETNDDEP
jgi:hypothetical protein